MPTKAAKIIFSHCSSECWRSSFVMRKLVDKLSIHCPNKTKCQAVMQRSTLEVHLRERCPGSIVRCQNAIFGCNFKGIRAEEINHIDECKFAGIKGDPLELLYPSCLKHVVELFRPDGHAELGLTIIGGNDTPIRNIVVQAVLLDSLVDVDGRIRPGDVIIEINGENFHDISHFEARAVLCESSPLFRFTLMRESFVEQKSVGADNNQDGTQITVNINKPPSKELGIKLTSYGGGKPGVYIQEVLPGRVAHSSGLLQAGDRILKVSQIDLSNSNCETTAFVIQVKQFEWRQILRCL